MRNVQQIRTVSGDKTELTLIDGSKFALNYFRLCVLAHELFTLGRHKEGLFYTIQNGSFQGVQDSHTSVTVEKTRDGQPEYRFRYIRLKYEKYGSEYAFVVVLPNGIPLELDEALELGEVLREHSRFFFYSSVCFCYSERVQKYLGEAEREATEEAPDADDEGEEDGDDVCLPSKEEAQSDDDCKKNEGDKPCEDFGGTATDICCENCSNWNKEEKRCLKGWGVVADDDDNGETETE